MNLPTRHRTAIKRITAVRARYIGNSRIEKKWPIEFPLAPCFNGTSEGLQVQLHGNYHFDPIWFLGTVAGIFAGARGTNFSKRVQPTNGDV